MKGIAFFPAGVLLLLTCSPLFVIGQQCRAPDSPRAIYSTTQLPKPDYGMSVVYDGVDSILIFNGRSAAIANRAIYRYNITSEEITRLGTLSTRGTYAPLFRESSTSYLYFGNASPKRVLEFDPTNNTSTIVADFTGSDISTLESFYSISYYHFFMSSHGLGSSNVTLYGYRIGTFCLEKIGNITGVSGNVPALSFGSHAYAFNSSSSNSAATYSVTTRINRETGVTNVLGSTNIKFDYDYNAVTTVTTDNYAYVMAWSILSPYDGILQYHPDTNEFKFIRIDDMPQDWGTRYINPPSMVFVTSLNRIYFFGGRQHEPDNMLDKIWYIDVSTIE